LGGIITPGDYCGNYSKVRIKTKIDDRELTGRVIELLRVIIVFRFS